jgi:hypothetical protein
MAEQRRTAEETMPQKLFFELAGRQIVIRALDPQLDSAFVSLHTAILTPTSHSWDSLALAAKAFFSKPGVGVHEHDRFFENLTILWRHFLTAGNFAQAEGIWEMAIGFAWD